MNAEKCAVALRGMLSAKRLRELAASGHTPRDAALVLQRQQPAAASTGLG